MKKTALIMAGGRGERFWPRSRKNLPKQFLSLTDDGKTMIQLTVERISPVVDLEDVYIATNEAYRDLVLMQLPGLPAENVICEPVPRNTAPCIGLGAMYISKKYKDAIMFVLPSDHLIKDNNRFVDVLDFAAEKAEQDANLVTIGITPNYPETGYGYIKYVEDKKEDKAYRVEKFVEKPNYETAVDYLNNGSYLWNSGMFVWKVSTILGKFESLMKDTYDNLFAIKEAIGHENEKSILTEKFQLCEAISVDYGVMERAEDIFVLPGDFGWDDVGSWLAVERIKKTDDEGNVLTGNVITVDTKNTTIEGSDKLIAAVGLEDFIVVDTDDAILICNKRHSGEIKKVLEILRQKKEDKYL